MSDFLDNLDALIADFKAAGWYLADALNPGLAPEALNAFERRLRFKMPDELRELYLRHNGARGDADANGFIQGFWFSPLEETVSLYEYYNSHQMFAPGELEKRWLPFHTNPGVDAYLVDCSSSEKRRGRVLKMTKEEDVTPVIYTNLSTMVCTLRACLSEGAIEIDVDGRWQVDPDRRRAIARPLNPGANYWTPPKVEKSWGEMSVDERRKDVEVRRRHVARSKLEMLCRLILDKRTSDRIRMFTETNRGSLTLLWAGPEADIPRTMATMIRDAGREQSALEVVEVAAGEYEDIDSDYQPIDPSRREAPTYTVKEMGKGKVRLFHVYSWGRRFLWEGKLDAMPPRWREELSI